MKTPLRAVLLLALPVASCTIERTDPPPVTDAAGVARAGIAAALNGYEAALLAGDAPRLAAYFTPDARLQEPGAEDLVGRGAIAHAMRTFFDERRVTAVDIESESIDVAGTLAWQLGSFEERFQVGNGAEQTVRGRFVIRWQRGPDDSWRIDRFLLNHLPAGPDTARSAAAPRL